MENFEEEEFAEEQFVLIPEDIEAPEIQNDLPSQQNITVDEVVAQFSQFSRTLSTSISLYFTQSAKNCNDAGITSVDVEEPTTTISSQVIPPATTTAATSPSILSMDEVASHVTQLSSTMSATLNSYLASHIQLRPSWNTMFATAVKALQIASANLPRDIQTLRWMSDYGVPAWLPTLPQGVTSQRSRIPPGEWFFPSSTGLKVRENGSPQVMAEGKYILYFHGGAFCCCNSATHRGLLMNLVKHTEASLLAVDYRRPPEHPYPIPVDDCLSAYLFILEKVGDSSRIILAGDSAGGNLVINTLLRIASHDLPRPAGAILISPWVDLTDTQSGSWQENAHIDYLRPDLAIMFASHYQGGFVLVEDCSVEEDGKGDAKDDEGAVDKDTKGEGQAEASTSGMTGGEGESFDLPTSARGTAVPSLQELSPVFSADLGQLPPLLVEVGECEVLRDQILVFCDRAKAAGVSVQCNVREDMVHVFPIYSFSGMPQCAASFADMVLFVNGLFHFESESLPPAVEESLFAELGEEGVMSMVAGE